MHWTKLKAAGVLALSTLVIASCTSLEIKAPTGVDRGIYNGAGADGGAGQG